MSRRFRILALALGLPSAALLSQARTPPVQLVVHLAVDQLRADYLTKWESQFTGGFIRLLRGGVFYPAGEQDHAVTQTAPGHASMMSGRWPYRTGIVANDRGVPDADYPLLGSTGPGASPARFRGTTLYDWMRATWPAARVLSVSRKDRGAILPVGRAQGSVFWFDRGQFTTSRWYGRTLPDWVTAWNATDPVGQLLGHVWTPLADIHYTEQDDRPFERNGKNNAFPYPLPTDHDLAASEIVNQPVMDSLTLAFAWRGFRAMHLGQEGHPDYLAISLSTTDAIGHRYGPGSLEIHDQVLRLDRQLGWFLDSLASVIPLDHVVISLTADHGATPYPESSGGGRFSLREETAAVRAYARDRWNIDIQVADESGLVLADTAALHARGVPVDSISRALASAIRGRPGVRDVLTPATFRARTDVESMRWHRQIPPDVGWLVAVAIEPGWLYSSGPGSTSHGSTNLSDRQVPILIMAPGVPPRRVTRAVGVVDLAPTIARLIGVRPTEPLDGHPLAEVIPSRR
ncbi:MAG TPA: alkaline phosphatase family protein [Gemmatimonadales bacterium]|nr:alkaline phosphatase family protein [Gemmatimonadales bacterium]